MIVMIIIIIAVVITSTTTITLIVIIAPQWQSHKQNRVHDKPPSLLHYRFWSDAELCWLGNECSLDVANL
jgi:hypothetical protein